MTPDQLHDFASRYTAAWCAHDAPAAAAFFAEDGTYSVNGNEPAIGRTAVAAAIQAACDAFPDGVLTLDSVRGAGNEAVFLWTWNGTNTGPGGTGSKVTDCGWEAWTFSKDGLIAQSLGHFDVAEFERQLGEGT